MDGIFLLDKASGISSRDACDQLAKKLNIKDKIGHTGTLDPLASGLLVVLVGKATKLANYIDNSTKEYVVKMEFGYKTDSYDIEGNVIQRSDIKFTDKQLYDSIEILKNKKTQIPPIYSAIKINGKKLYDYALKNIHVAIEEREVSISEIEIIEYSFPYLTLRLKVNKGFYVRSFVNDLGEMLGSYSTMVKLRRIKSGNFSLDKAKNIDNINFENFILIEDILSSYPKIEVSDYLANLIKSGILLDERQYHSRECFCVYNNGKLLAFYEPYKEKEFKIVLQVN